VGWAVELSRSAKKDLQRLPRDRRLRLERAIDEIEQNPFAGDTKPLTCARVGHPRLYQKQRINVVN